MLLFLKYIFAFTKEMFSIEFFLFTPVVQNFHKIIIFLLMLLLLLLIISCMLTQTEILLKGFFEFFGNKFDYGNCVVSIRKGQRTTKEEVTSELRLRSKLVTDNLEGESSIGEQI